MCKRDKESGESNCTVADGGDSCEEGRKEEEEEKGGLSSFKLSAEASKRVREVSSHPPRGWANVLAWAWGVGRGRGCTLCLLYGSMSMGLCLRALEFRCSVLAAGAACLGSCSPAVNSSPSARCTLLVAFWYLTPSRIGILVAYSTRVPQPSFAREIPSLEFLILFYRPALLTATATTTTASPFSCCAAAQNNQTKINGEKSMPPPQNKASKN